MEPLLQTADPTQGEAAEAPPTLVVRMVSLPGKRGNRIREGLRGV